MKKYKVTLSSPGGAIEYAVVAWSEDAAIDIAKKKLAREVSEHNAKKYRHCIAEEIKDENG